MKTIAINSTEHDFRKENLVGVKGKHGIYDKYKCLKCGLIGYSYQLGKISFRSSYSDRKINKCKGNEKPVKKVRVIKCEAVGKMFANLTPGSVHDVVPTPKDQPDNLAGVWVMGVDRPVKLLVREYEVVDE